MNKKLVGYGSMASTSDVQFSGNSQLELVNLCDNIATNIYTINQSCKTLEGCCRSLGTKRDNEGLRGKIHVTQLSTNEIVAVTTINIQKLNQLVRKGDKQKKLQAEKLKDDFSDSIARYSTLQTEVSEKMKSNILLMADVSSEPVPGAEFLQQEQALKARELAFEQESLLDRESQIRKIEVDIIDVNKIMRDLTIIVNEQREGIDRLEGNIDYTAANVEEGTEHLVKASGYENKYRRKLCYLVIIAFIVSAILVTVLVTQLKTN